MAQLANQPVQATGSQVNLAAAAAGGDTVQRGDTAFLLVQNPTAGAITVTIDVPETLHGHAVTSEGVVVAAGAHEIIPLGDAIFVHPTDHLIHLAYSAAGLLVACVSL